MSPSQKFEAIIKLEAEHKACSCPERQRKIQEEIHKIENS